MNKKFSRSLLVICFLKLFAPSLYSQSLNVEIVLPESDPAQISVRGKMPEERAEKQLLFPISYADAGDLASRIDGLVLSDISGQRIEYKKLADGSYAAARPFSAFSYRLNAAFPQNATASAHISWVSGQKGILRLNDLLPVFEKKYDTRLSIRLPVDWKISTSEKLSEGRHYAIENHETAVFAIGRQWSARNFAVSDARVDLAIDDRWNLDPAAAEKITGRILTFYENHFGPIPEKNLRVIYFKMPETAGFDRWRAETSGANIIVMSAPTVFESRLRQRFQEQLRHELFHLWMPNDLALNGDYAWFYEGFAQYAALRAGVELNQITFGDFLNTLEQAYNFGNRRSQPVSLIEASKNRWFIENSSVYAKGLAVAFLFDVALLRASNGKRGLFSVLRQIYEKHRRPNKALEANAAILRFLENYGELSPIIEDYVRGSERLDFAKYIGHTGIEIDPDGSLIKLRVGDDLSRREKDFLDKLGYNNWRKFLSK